MPIDPQEDPPIKPGQPSEPPQESPPGNPRPEVPPPMRDPGEPPTPEELPGRIPDELPVRGPQGPPASPATDAAMADCRAPGPISIRARRIGRGGQCKYDLKPGSECAMNKGASGLYAVRNKNRSGFEGRHNPA
jgi:hypothetical protein